MIYESVIKEMQKPKLDFPTELDIMREYYENEISFLNMVIDHNNTLSTVTESDIEVINESTVKNIIEKIKIIFNKFVEWCKKIFNIIKDKLYSNFKKEKIVVEKIKKEIKLIESNSSLNNEEKETKKLEAIKPIIKNENLDSDDIFISNNNKQKYKFIMLEVLNPHVTGIGSKNVMKVLRFLDNLHTIDEHDEEKMEKVKYYIDNLDKILDIYSVPSGIELFKMTGSYIVEKELTPEEVIEINENNLKRIEKAKQDVTKFEKENEQYIKNLKNIINKINRQSPDKGISKLTYQSQLINKTIAYLQKYTQSYIEYLGEKLKAAKPVLVN